MEHLTASLIGTLERMKPRISFGSAENPSDATRLDSVELIFTAKLRMWNERTEVEERVAGEEKNDFMNGQGDYECGGT